MHNPQSPYRKEGDTYLIEIKLSELRQLFNSLDPAPFREKDLDQNAEDYIVDSAREFPVDTPVKLVLHLPAHSCGRDERENVEAAIHHYFAYRADITAKELRFALRQGRSAVVVGLAFLVGCLAGQQFIAMLGLTALPWLILQEGLLIGGWVAMWKAIDIFLYEWWSIRRKRQVYEKLAAMPVELQARTQGVSG